MAEKSVEERLGALEAAVAELQRRLGPPVSMEDWLKRVGTVTDAEAIDEAYRLGREFRDADRPPDGEEVAP